MVRRAGAEHMQLLAHCNGDAACAQYLAALETAAREGVDLTAMRPVMIHAQLLGRDQVPEVRRLGVIPSFFAGHVYHWGDIHLENLGPERAARISPAGSAAALGIPFTLHTDAPVLPPDILETVWCAVIRVTRSGRVLGPKERVDVSAALAAVTANAAYQYFEEGDKGTLARGLRADLVVLDRDPLAAPPEELRDIRVLETWKDGRPVFRMGDGCWPAEKRTLAISEKRVKIEARISAGLEEREMEKKSKLVLAVLQGSDCDNTIRNLNERGFMVTLLSSTGGFLKKKSTTVMIGVEEDRLEEAMDILQRFAGRRRETVYQSMTMPHGEMSTVPPMAMEVMAGGAAVFILDLEDIRKF